MSGWRIALMLALFGLSIRSEAAAIAVFAAGSLRAPLTEIAREFQQRTGHEVLLTFGASGLLHDRIAAGAQADVFASANVEHPQSLVSSGWTDRVQPFARNSMCLLARRDLHVTPDTVLPTMLDPAVKLGTSTPKADPSGDYAVEVFRKADSLRPGAFATLSSKALPLTGGPNSPPPPADRSMYAVLISSGTADAFLTYCTNAELAHREVPALEAVKLPQALRVGAEYGMAVRRDASPAAREFAAFLLGDGGSQRLRAYGFDPP